MRGRKDLNPSFLKSSPSDGLVTSNTKLSSRSSSQSTSSSMNITSHLKRARASGSLNISNSNLTSIPQEICNYYISPIDESENFWEMYPLTKLDLSYNKISSIPDSISQLTDLVSLKLRDNVITKIPLSMESCKLLVVLDLTGNQIETVDEFIGELKDLKELLLSNNKLHQLHHAINNCQLLHTLEIHNNKLKFIPELYGFPYLTKLHLSGNLLEFLPINITTMNTITSLDIKKNKLKLLPNLSGLKGLLILDVSENMLEEFPTLPDNGLLDRLYLSNNMITSIDVDALMNIRYSVTELHLNDNKIKYLPPEIGYLVKLIILNVANNDLSDLPVSLGYITSLNKILLDGNPIRTIRRTLLIMQATNDLKAYLKTRGDPLAGQIREDDDVHSGSIKKGESNKLSSHSTIAGSKPISSKLSTSASNSSSSSSASSTSPIVRLFEDKVRDITGGILDLSNIPKLLTDNRDWPQILYDILLKFTSAIPLGSDQSSRSSSLVKSMAEIGGDDETVTGSFSPLSISKLDLSRNGIKTPWLVYDSKGFSLLASSSSNPSVLENLQWLNMANNILSIETSHTVDILQRLDSRYEYYLLPSTLKYLDLSFNKINNYQLDLLLRGLTNLQELHASGNTLEAFPRFIDEMGGYQNRGFCDCRSTLRVLRLGNNRLQSLDGFELLSFPRLETLDLSDNQLTSIHQLVSSNSPTMLGSVRLSTLLLVNNILRDIPPELGLFTNLTHLALHGNPQKIIRTHQLDNVESILSSLRNKLPSQTLPQKDVNVSSKGIRTETDDVGGSRTTSYGISAKSNTQVGSVLTPRQQLERDINELERQLSDNFSLSGTKKLEIQKSLALKRANYNRLK